MVYHLKGSERGMAAKQKNSKSQAKYRRRRLLATLAITALFIYFGYSIGSDIYAIYRQKQALEAINQQTDIAEAQRDELARVVESGTKEEQLERIAREKLGYGDSDERTYVDTVG